MAIITLLEAINQAIDQAMEKDESIVVFGEDAGFEGGVFRVSWPSKRNMVKQVFDTPIAESAIVGSAVGMAINGLKPIAEIQFDRVCFPRVIQI